MKNNALSKIKHEIQNLAIVGKGVFNVALDNLTFGAWSESEKVFAEIHARNKKRDFDLFLWGIHQHSKDISVSDILLKLQNKEFDRHVASIIDAVFFSRSDTCLLTLAIIANKEMFQQNCDYMDLMLVSHLRNCLDCDLELFGELHSNVNNPNYTLIADNNTDAWKVESFIKLETMSFISRQPTIGSLTNSRDPLGCRYVPTALSDRLFQYISLTHEFI